MKTDRVEWHLYNWSGWMHAAPKLGIERFPVLASNASQDFDEMCDQADQYAAKATDAAIEDLLPAEQAAVYRKWLDAVYQFPRHNFLDMYQSALKKLAPKLDAQGLV